MIFSQERWRELSTLIDGALELPPGDRAGWVEGLEGVDDETRRLLRQLVDDQAQPKSGDVLETMPRLLAETQVPRKPADPDLVPGMVIAGYRLERLLGTGGMGAVWLAERIDGLIKRPVALKLPHPGMVGPSFTERWHRERQILSSLEHPNIARLYDAGFGESGRPFLALEFVAGEDIKTYCDRLRMPVNERIRLFLQVLGATQYAHSRLVVHRDIKPTNVLVNESGQAVLLDFGIAKVLDDGVAEETMLTREIGRQLTPAYASPEQVSASVLTTASDVYSLGVVLFELLTGERPYAVRNPSRRALEEAILASEPLRPSACVRNGESAAARSATPAALARALRGDLDTILAMALKKRPEDRYRSVDAFASDLQNHLRGLPVAAQPDSAWYRARKFIGRNRLAVGSAVTIFVALAAGLGVALWQSAVARTQAERADVALLRQSAIRNLYVEAMAAIANADPKALAQPGAVMHLLRDKLVEAEPLYKDRPQELLGMLNVVCVQLNFAGDFEGALEVGRHYLELIKKSPGEPEAVVEAHMSVARNLSHLGRYDESAKVLRDAVNWNPDLPGVHIDHARVEIASDLAWALTNLGRRGEARQVLAEAERIGARRFADDRITIANVQMMGRLELGYDDAAALAYAQRARDRFFAYSAVEGVELAGTLGQYGMALLAAGQAAPAEAPARDATRRAEELFGAADRDTMQYFGLIVTSLARQGKYEAARQLLAEKLAALKTSDSDETRKALVALRGHQIENEVLFGDPAAAALLIGTGAPQAYQHSLRNTDVPEIYEAQYLSWTGRNEEALRRLAALEAQLPPPVRQGPVGFQVAAAIVQVQIGMARYADAEAGATALVSAIRAAGATGNWTYPTAIEMAALAAARAGKIDDARRWLAERDTVPPQVQPPSAVDSAESLLRRAQVLHACGRLADAGASVEQAKVLLGGQHPQSPRRAEAIRLTRIATVDGRPG